MSVWLPGPRLAERRAAAGDGLAALADSLAFDLERVLASDVTLPPEKARLSRSGGRCAADGALLAFDPWSPRVHRCPSCGRVYEEEAHYRWWIMNRQLWLAERSVHAALLHALRGDARHASLATSILQQATDAYLTYPNQDNVLGPTRPFFSTYLESIWLLQLCTALDMLETVGAAASLSPGARERLVAPSAALIASYDEGFSNRQVWNNAALLAASALLDDDTMAERAVWGPSGLAAHLSAALLSDGSWYEGENYHLFAHRGLWYGVRLAEAAGQWPLPEPLVSRFREGFVTPFLTALPDLTVPARRDSQYASSLRQWRFAELAELGLASTPGEPRLHQALATLYERDVPRGDTGRWRSTAEAERNEPASGLSRADLGWRSLLEALPELPPLRPRPPATVLLEAQGLAVFRRDGGTVYAALDYGESGGGHGHPDRLQLLLSVGDERWLDDPGTGSYVDPSLHWYRSTLAHNAPLVEGRSQQRAAGRLLAFEERQGAGWADAVAEAIAPGVTVWRTLVVMPDYLLDLLAWRATRVVEMTLPLHHDAEVEGPSGWTPARASGFEGGVELSEVECARTQSATGRLRRDGAMHPIAWVLADAPLRWWRAVAPGPPGRPPRRVHLACSTGEDDEGSIACVWSWRGAVREALLEEDAVVVRTADGGEQRHTRAAHGWHVDLRSGAARSSIDLGGSREEPELPVQGYAGVPEVSAPVLDRAFRFALGERDYRRSEPSWEEAGSPTAAVELSLDARELRIVVDVRKAQLAFAPVGGVNEMDNERPEINGDGVQLHVVAPAARRGAMAMLGWLLVPVLDGSLHVVALDERAAAVALRARWSPTMSGYLIDAGLPLGELAPTRPSDPAGTLVAIGVIVNDGAPGRERRRGQLVLGGAAGEFVYLRGDRHDPARCIPFLLPHD